MLPNGKALGLHRRRRRRPPSVVGRSVGRLVGQAMKSRGSVTNPVSAEAAAV